MSMARDPATTNRLDALLSKLLALTKTGQLHWERELGSAHRYARWNNNLLIIGPADPPAEKDIPRYLFITPFDSPACIEINSNDERHGKSLMELIALVETASDKEPPSDPFAISDDDLARLTG